MVRDSRVSFRIKVSRSRVGLWLVGLWLIGLGLWFRLSEKRTFRIVDPRKSAPLALKLCSSSLSTFLF